MDGTDPNEAIPDDGHVVLFDGVCNLCHGLVQFVVRRDPERTFRFASLQSQIGQSLLEEHDLPTDSLESVVLVRDGECFVKSGAALRIAWHLGGVYRLLLPFLLVPPFVRDAVYRFVADHRYQWFGKKDSCLMPSPDVESRFLSDPSSEATRDSDE